MKTSPKHLPAWSEEPARGVENLDVEKAQALLETKGRPSSALKSFAEPTLEDAIVAEIMRNHPGISEERARAGIW